MRHDDLRTRSKNFALAVMDMTDLLPSKPKAWVVSKQILRSATSVAANYRAAGRGRSLAEFTAKIGVVVEEADETVFWLEMIQASRLLDDARVKPLISEANELLRIFSASYQTARAKQRV
jgi:four helix bundle protein